MSFFSRLLGKAPSSDRSAPSPQPKPAADTAKPASEPFADVVTLPFGERLTQIALDESHPAMRTAHKRAAELIDGQQASVDDLPFDSRAQKAVLTIAAATSDPLNFERLAKRVEDRALWVDLAAHGSTARVRQLAAAQVQEEQDLRAVMKSARERDKNVYRIAKTKLDDIHAAAKRVEEAKAHMRSLAETIERQSYKPFDNAFVATIEHLEREWRALQVEISPDLKAKVDSAIDRSREAIAEHIRAAGAQAAQEAAVANAEPLRTATLDELKKILTALYVAESFDEVARASVRERVTKLRERWQDTLQYKSARADESRDFDRLSRAVEHVSGALVEHGPLNAQLQIITSEPNEERVARLDELVAGRELLGDDPPALLLEAQSATQRWRQEQSTKRETLESIEHQIGQLIRKSQHALTAGRSRQAFGIRRSIDAKLEQLPKRPKHLLDRLQQLDTKLQEIQDWRNFAVTPKRSELIAQMQALIGSEDEPTQLAEEIKRLQEEWKTLAKGSADSDDDWAKFHEAAQAAYAPCKAHFEAQAQLRAQNLEKRKALLAKLEDYERTTDWQTVDWRNVASALRLAKQEWRTSGPTERAATRPLEKRFDDLWNAIQARLDQEYASNLERKQTLVKQAQRLATAEDHAQAVIDVKRLQTAWRSVGLTPHVEGQRLWDEFKQHCDAVFEQRRKEHTDRMAELEQNEEQAQAQCIELESLSQRTGAELYAGAQRVRELRDAFAQIGELPRDKAQEIQRRFRRAVEEFEHALKQERQREANQTWDSFFDAANRIRLVQSQPNGQTAEALRAHIEALEHWPKGGKAAIEQKLARAPQLNIEENAAALRSIVIRAEIATGTATPEPDQSQRRAMQLQALVKGIGRSTGTAREQMESLAFEWIEVGPVPNDIYDSLWSRFWRCWQLAGPSTRSGGTRPG